MSSPPDSFPSPTMKFRRPKSILTDYRASRAPGPPGAGASSPMERHSVRPWAAACPKPNFNRDRAGHDKAAASLSDFTLLAAARDLGKRRVTARDMESRWVGERLAALAREIDKRGLNHPARP